MTRKFNSFEEWVAAQPAPPVPEPPPPELPIVDAVDQWRRDGEEREQQRADAAQERHEIERRAVRDQHLHEIQLAKAAASGDIDWTEVLSTIALTLGSVADRLDALEARVSALDGNKSNGKVSDLETELVDLPRFLMPRRGYETGWPL